MDAAAYIVPEMPMTRYEGVSRASSAVMTTVQNSRWANNSSIWMTSVKNGSDSLSGVACRATTNRPTKMSSIAG